jgi:prepilin-type N-terminal cleavage/methylation domain-containing protein
VLSFERSRGFTLIELLVVVSIIALLISILIPSLSNARAQARLVKCLASQRSLGQAGVNFTQEHGGYFQLSATESGRILADSGRSRYAYDSAGEALAWPVALARASGVRYQANWSWGIRMKDFTNARLHQSFMASDFPVVTCPSDKVQISTPFYPRAGGYGNGLKGSAPADHPPVAGTGDTTYWGFLSYGINEDVVGTEVSASANPGCWKDGNRGELSPLAGHRLQGNMDRIFNPSEVLLLADAGPSSVAEAEDGSQGYANLFISAQSPGPYLGDFQLQWRKRMAEKRHPGGRVAVLFSDFHGQPVRAVEFYSDASIKKLPIRYAPRVRISPYPPHGAN